MRTCVLFLALAACHGGGTTPDPDDTGVRDRGELVGIQLAPYNPSAVRGETVQFSAKAFYEDTSHEDVTADVAWVSTDSRVATVDASGVATALETGTADIVATADGGVSAKVTLTVKAEGAEISSVSIAPGSLDLAVGEEAELAANAQYTDGTTGNVSASCAWTSTDEDVATVTAGAVRGVAAGTARVSATCGSLTSSEATIDVSEEGFDLPEADLRVSFFEATVTGDDVEYTVIVENEGGGYARAFWVDVFLDLDETPDAASSEDGIGWVPGLGAGESTPVYVYVEDVAPGAYSSWVSVDREEAVTESVRRNNTSGPIEVSVTDPAATRPELRVSALEAVSDGSYSLYEVTVENAGGGTAGGFWLDLFLDSPSDPEIGDIGDDFEWIDGLAPGASFTWFVELEDGPTTSWRSCALADSLDAVEEPDEGDNVTCETVVAE